MFSSRIFVALLGLSYAVSVAGCGPTRTEGHVYGGKQDPHDIQATAPGTPTCMSTSPTETATAIGQTNVLRRANGMAPLSPDPRMMAAAQAHACDMAARGLMSHHGSRTTGPMKRLQQNGYNPRIVSENIGAGPFDLHRILSEWNRSREHRDNILIADTRHFGIGSALGADGKTMFWAGVYAVPMPQ